MRRAGALPSSFTAAFVEDVLSVSGRAAGELVLSLAAAELIEADDGDPGYWRLTTRGLAVANATAAKPVKRLTAERALHEFLARIQAINADARYSHRVLRVVVFGSYLGDGPTVNDVDVALEYGPRLEDAEAQKAHERERIRLASAGGRRFSNITQRIFWPLHEVVSALKARSRVISLHDLREHRSLLAAQPYRIVLEAPGAPPWTLARQERHVGDLSSPPRDGPTPSRTPASLGSSGSAVASFAPTHRSPAPAGSMAQLPELSATPISASAPSGYALPTGPSTDGDRAGSALEPGGPEDRSAPPRATAARSGAVPGRRTARP